VLQEEHQDALPLAFIQIQSTGSGYKEDANGLSCKEPPVLRAQPKGHGGNAASLSLQQFLHSICALGWIPAQAIGLVNA